MRYRVDFYQRTLSVVARLNPARAFLELMPPRTKQKTPPDRRSPKIRQSHGPKAGFLVTDMNHVPVRMGPGAYEDASGP